MPSLSSAAAAAGWCPVCHQTGDKHTKDCTPEKRKARARWEMKLILIVYSPFILLIIITYILQLMEVL